ncbi:hypothetical protein [Bacteriovorax sp. Seq25_V]|uniref:hypothetical protein n=1 Tax=Bacteriovorax sp. Seq25_V TaxID=1201288 RepID=UPI0012F70E72|nr:hypothetical protein [Bacteriovorax sp. Seq25_V]
MNNLIEVLNSRSPAYRLRSMCAIDDPYIDFLKKQAARHELKRARILLHPEEENKYHSMLIVKVKGCVEKILALPAESKKIQVLKGSFEARRNGEKVIYGEDCTVEFNPQHEFEFEVLSDILIIKEEITYF